MVERKTWEEFQATQLLWWINRLLHTFGWAIVYNCKPDGTVTEVYPARVKFRGFTEGVEDEGFLGLTQYLQSISKELVTEVVGNETKEKV